MRQAVLLSIILLSAFANAEMVGQVNIERIAPEQGFVGQKLWVLLTLENMGPNNRTVSIREMLGDAEFNESEATPFETLYNKTYWFYEWEILLPAYENATVGYWLIPRAVGSYVIPSSEVVINNASVYYLREAEITIRCNADSSCEPGETYLNCPEDCPSGSDDGICDGRNDASCDPDCEPSADPDCAVQTTTQTPSQDLLLPALGVITVLAIAGIAIKTGKKKTSKAKKAKDI